MCTAVDNSIMASLPTPQITEEEYLRLERAAEAKSELVDGEIFAMPGKPLVHVVLAVKLSTGLSLMLRGRDCIVLGSDMRIRTQRSGSYVYPDVSIVCGKPQTHQTADDILTNPTVVVEVLSPATADYNRGKKFELYREIASLQDYIMVHTGSVHVEHFSRQPGSWLFREYCGAESSVTIASIDCTVLLGDVYDEIPDVD